MKKDSQLSPLCSGRLEPEADPDKQANTTWAPGPLPGRRVVDPRHDAGRGASPQPTQPQLPRPPSLGLGEAWGSQGLGELLRRV